MSTLTVNLDRQAAPAAPEASPRARAANMIAIASGKGGVGKTFFAVTLAHALALAGRRVLLFDGDLGLANVDVQIGLMPDRDLASVVAGRITMAQARTPYPLGGFDVIAGRSGAGSLAALPPTRLSLLGGELVALTRHYDTAIMDLGAGIDRMIRHLASFAGCRLVVVNAEPTSLTDGYAFLKMMLADDPTADLRIVVNQARSAGDAERTFATVERACQSFLRYRPKFAGFVHRDRRVTEAIRTQTPLLTRFPDTEAARDIRAIAAKLMQDP